jgi:hypothetical protein
MECVTCSRRAVYKCRSCRAAFCSPACGSTHQRECPGPQHTRVEAEVKVATNARGAEALRPANPDEELLVLDHRHLECLRASPQIRNLLKTSELQTVVKTIDASRSRLDALEAACHNIPEFAEFCQEVLRTLKRHRPER